MSASEERKRPSGSRPQNRRLVSSSDTVPSGTAPTTSDTSAPLYHDEQHQAALRLDLESVDGQLDLFADTPPPNVWTTSAGLVESPRSLDSPSWQSRASPLSPPASTQSASTPRIHPLKKPSPLSFSAESTSQSDVQSDVPESPSVRRWETLRRHVLRDPALDEVPLTPSLPILTPNRPSLSPPPTTTTPSAPVKQFRLPRRFRQVVEQAQEASTNSTKRFADDVFRAVMVARVGEQRFARREREGTGSAPFSRPFVTPGSTIPHSVNASLTNLSQTRFGLPRRAPSISTLPTPSSLAPSSGALHALIANYAANVAAPATTPPDATLPHETNVLAALLSPFLNTVTDQPTASARWQSLETFQTLIKTWPSNSNEIELERCFWCCKAAQAADVDKELRIRILGVLSSGLFAPRVLFRAEAPLVLQTLLQALFSLLASLLELERAGEEASLVRELITGALHGACGDLEPDLVLQDLGVRMQRGDEVFVRTAIVMRALSSCLELDTAANRAHIVELLSDDFWRLDTNANLRPKELEPLYASTLARCARAILEYLPAPEKQSDYAKRTQVLIFFRDHLLPQTAALVDDAAAEPRMFIALVVLRMICLQGSAEQEEARILLAQWHSVDRSPWTAAFESALRQMCLGVNQISGQ